MSNFQRTRSKVWWGDSPQNLGSPIPHASNREGRFQLQQPNDDWEPQLPHWVPQEPDIQDMEESPPLPAVNVWSRRQSSPGSHKSQDSGFSDSDSSPPTQKDSLKDKSETDDRQVSNENEKSNSNRCCQNEQTIEDENHNHFKTPLKKDLSSNALNYLQTPKTGINKFRSGTPVRSLIKTPKDLQDYLQAHCDIGHRSFDNVENSDIHVSNCNSSVKVAVTPCKNMNSNNIVFEKCTTKKNLLEKFNEYSSDSQNECIDTEKICGNSNQDVNSISNIEYIQVSPSHQIAVNNQPRMRSPITRLSYHPPVHFITKDSVNLGLATNMSSKSSIPNNEKSINEDDYGFRANQQFQRNGMNRSFHYTTQRLDEQILDEGSHSLGYIEIMHQTESTDFINNKKGSREDADGKGFSSRKITDSLNLKTPKKISTSRTKQKIQSKASKAKQSPKLHKSFFHFLPKRNDSIKTIYDITRGSSDMDRVPTLGLPSSHNCSEWEHTLDENNFEERCIDENTPNINSNKSKSPKSILKTPGSGRKITPPIQFQDENNSIALENKQFFEDNAIFHKPMYTSNGILVEKSSSQQNRVAESNLRREESSEDIHFCEMELNAACTSTPKTVLPKDYLRTPKTTNRQGGKMKPVNLLSNFNESARISTTEISDVSSKRNTPITALETISNDQPAPVQHWLCELVGLYEPECMTTLQSKALGVEMNAKVTTSSATITGNIRKVQTHGQIIAHQYKQVMKDLQGTNIYFLQQCQTEINTMIANINEFILAHSITLKIKPPGETPDRWDKIKIALQHNIQKVIEVTEDVKIELNETHPEMNVLEKHLRTLLDIFVETARAVLVQQTKTLVSMLEDPPSDMILKSTLTSLGHLGALMSPEVDIDILDSEAEAMRFITELPFVECGVPRALLSVIIESNKSSIKALSLRALATICITSEAVKQFEEAGGIEIVSDILNEESNPEPQMREGVTVLTQITAPWLQGDYRLKQLDSYLETILQNLTAILSKTSCCQLLLLCTACLVNLVNLVKQKERLQSMNDSEELKTDIIDILGKHKTIENILEAVKKRGPSASVFLQEQTATLINAVSSSSKGRTILAGCPAAPVALVCFLRTPRASPARPARLQAEFRLVNQAAEALARLCTIPEITSQIIQLEGASRLVRVINAQKLQKTDGKCSDQILVNCLRALRAIAKVNMECFKDVDCDVTDMIRPALMDSVKLYSAKQESYV